VRPDDHEVERKCMHGFISASQIEQSGVSRPDRASLQNRLLGPDTPAVILSALANS
jgi:hypothetical protein